MKRKNKKQKQNPEYLLSLKYNYHNTYIVNHINMGHLSLGINTGIYHSYEEK